MGESSRYEVNAVLLRDGEKLDENSFKLGIRTVKLERSDVTDSDGNGEFRFTVNGKPVFIRGTNWVPMDAFHSRDKQRLPKALEMLWDINCNAVRCWGGGVYEDHEFYDFCDEKGILVWQDFMMGCAAYPQNERVCSLMRDEAVSVIKKLRHHPSIAIWAGDNECDVAACQWEEAKRDPSWNRLTREVLDRAVKDYDPIREYLPSSPYVSAKAFAEGSENILPEDHLWGRGIITREAFTQPQTLILQARPAITVVPHPI